jgi:uncharacterized protein with HEPN domain
MQALFRLTVMGEAVKRLSLAFRAAHPEVEWSDIAGLRGVIIHRYDHIDVDEIWKIATTDVPRLLQYLEALLPDDP